MGDDVPTGRVLFFEFGGLTFVAKDCHDIDVIEQKAGFEYCPICGGERDEHGMLEHEPEYTGDLH